MLANFLKFCLVLSVIGPMDQLFSLRLFLHISYNYCLTIKYANVSLSIHFPPFHSKIKVIKAIF